MLPAETYARLLGEDQVLGLKLLRANKPRVFYFRVKTAEQPINLKEFSLGAASPMNATGTDWNQIKDSDGRYQLEPEFENIIYQAFFGVSPGQARIYMRYPSAADIHSLLGTRAVGGAVGYVDGSDSPALYPSPQSEFFTIKEMHPSFLGYHPYAEPSSITVRLNFFVIRYDVEFVGMEPLEDGKADGLIVSQILRQGAVVRTVGSHVLVNTPSWLSAAAKVGA